MPSPLLGHKRKHKNHLALLKQMTEDGLPSHLRRAPSLRAAYELMLNYPGLGPFLAFQYAFDPNYSTLIDFDEDDFVVAGPGALDGISKCFRSTSALTAASVMQLMVDQQDKHLQRAASTSMDYSAAR